MEIARYLCHLPMLESSGGVGDADLLTPRRLEKLLYLLQGWSLVERGEPLFADALVARATGPAPASVERRFRAHGHLPICPPREPPVLSESDEAFIVAMWGRLRWLSESGLRGWVGQDRLWVGSSMAAAASRPWDVGACIRLTDLRRAFADASLPRSPLPEARDGD